MSEPNASRKRSNVIDENLRRVYDEALQEGVPDRFHDLLAALKEQDQSRENK
jgi:hypothetical protein